jgi:hypothetical protein
MAPAAIPILAAIHSGLPLLSAPPLTHDHPVHLFKAWHMATQMLPAWRLRGWSHFWAFGFPSDELVPPGGELWVLLFRVLTLGQLGWRETYAVALVGLLALCAFAAYRFTRAYFGTTAGVIAGLLVVWDPGGWASGGWYWHVTWGVWPTGLGMSLILLALASIETLIARGTVRQLAFAGAWVAAALLSHQIAIPFLPIMVGLLLVDHRLRRASPPGRLGLAVLACAFGAALAGFYLVPMLARLPQTLDLGAAGATTDEIARRLSGLRRSDGVWAALGVLGLAGAIAASRRRARGAFFLVAGTGAFLFLSTDLLFSLFHAERVLPGLHKIEAPRMMYGAKMLWCPLVAWAIALPFEDVSMGWLRKRWSWAAAVVACLALVLAFATSTFRPRQRDAIDPDEPGATIAYWNDLRAVWAHTAALRAASTERYRIAYQLPRNVHLSLLAPVFDGTPVYKVGYTPSQAYARFPMYADTRLFRLLSVKYVVTDRPIAAPGYTLERTFGRLGFYRADDFDPDPFHLIGAGVAELVEFSPERVRIRLRDTAPGSRLVLHVAYMDHWRARQGAETLRVTPAPVSGAEDPILMEVPASDGELVFEYVRCAPDWIGLLATLCAVPLLWGFSRAARAHPRWVRLPALSPRGRRAALGATAAATALLVSLIAVRLATRSALVPEDSLFRDLRDGEMAVNGAACQSDGSFHWTCGGYAVAAERVSGLYGTHLCITTAGSELALRTTRTVGEFLRGSYDVRGDDGSLRAWLDDRDLGRVAARPPDQGLQFLQFDTRDRAAGPGTYRLEIRGSPLHCFDFGVVR